MVSYVICDPIVKLNGNDIVFDVMVTRQHRTCLRLPIFVPLAIAVESCLSAVESFGLGGLKYIQQLMSHFDTDWLVHSIVQYNLT